MSDETEQAWEEYVGPPIVRFMLRWDEFRALDARIDAVLPATEYCQTCHQMLPIKHNRREEELLVVLYKLRGQWSKSYIRRVGQQRQAVPWPPTTPPAPRSQPTVDDNEKLNFRLDQDEFVVLLEWINDWDHPLQEKLRTRLSRVLARTETEEAS